jgi:Family of unknown function (DUF6526)
VEQSYANHRRLVPLYHYILALVLIVTIIGAAVNLFESFGTENLYSASLILVISVTLLVMAYLLRSFPLAAQDRAIRVEENLRHFALTGKLMDPRVTLRQIIGLRFASDEEFLELVRRATEESLSEDDIKRAIKNWRADHWRV